MIALKTSFLSDGAHNPAPDVTVLFAAAEAAVRAIPPVWPLASSVAVNPYLGQTRLDLAGTAALLARVAGAPVTMTRQEYEERIVSGAVTDEDLAAALAACSSRSKPASVVALKSAVHTPSVPLHALPTIADLAAEVSGIDWPGLIAERFGAWAGGYFDEGQALWAAPRGRSAYAAWRAVATHDLSPEIAGLRGFAAYVDAAPETAPEALIAATAALGLSPNCLDTCFHSLLITLGGWGHVARYRLWQAELGGQTDDTLRDFLVVRLIWDAALYAQYRTGIETAWKGTVAAHAAPVEPTSQQVTDAILQEACERASQRQLARTLSSSAPAETPGSPLLQVAFCIDVRSEVIRRALESIDPGIQTLGFAGFFGLTASHHRFASDVAEHRLPVLLNAGLTTRSGGPDDSKADLAARYRARAARAWERFKLAAVSSFALVEATGPVYVGKLLRDSLGLAGRAAPIDPAPRPDPALDLPVRIQMAESVLRAMSLTKDFAPLILLAGHGASVVNNPHASALNCGACGGYTGEVNARLLAGLLNDPDVRAGVNVAGLEIPPDTVFVGALHDTMTDHITLYTDDHPSAPHHPDLERARGWLVAAGVLARCERALRLPRARDGSDIVSRSRDWAETRPEWALAGCSAFIAAPRSRTRGKGLRGRAFLHDYDWRADDGFGILELILTAPVVVASWISLQYYGSTVSPELFGAGNKLLHNVVGGIGVLEGNGGVLRAGLPWQSVHDGVSLAHEPLRLTVCVEAPPEAIAGVLERHPEVRALFDNRWLHLMVLDDAGEMAWRYGGDLRWEAINDADRPNPAMPNPVLKADAQAGRVTDTRPPSGAIPARNPLGGDKLSFDLRHPQTCN